mgnify:CR=1 FL=1
MICSVTGNQKGGADNLLHALRHHFKGQGGPGENQHGEIQHTGDNACVLGILGDTAHHHANAQGRKYGQEPTASKAHPGAASETFRGGDRMKAFCTLLKNELKLNIRNMNMVIFALLLLSIRPEKRPAVLE